MDHGNLIAPHHANANAVEDRSNALRYVRPLWFPTEAHHVVEIEQADWWSVQEQLRDALARCARLEWTNRELRLLAAEMKSELLLRETESKTALRARPLKPDAKGNRTAAPQTRPQTHTDPLKPDA